MAKLVSWLDTRRAAFQDDIGQARAVAVSVYQDDLTVIAIGTEAAHTTESQVRLVLVEDYGVQLSTNQEANEPFGHSFSLLARHTICRIHGSSSVDQPSTPQKHTSTVQHNAVHT